ncbi:MAG TPA: DUF2975 domain-containing protein [Clostridia bacterium]|mgnify:CR=1 FL=1|nr:DUF2975 domain-containing protein [Clostridia bacterium]HRX41201.1 DUF2975 domain-containing protein [Clostridia bacterium]
MEMQEKKLKLFNFYKNIAKILFILSIVGGVLLIIASVIIQLLLMFMGPEIMESIQSFVASLGFEYTLPANLKPHLLVLVLELSGIASIALTAFILQSISRIFGNIVEAKTPFSPANIRKVRGIGIALFVYTGVQFVLHTLISAQVGMMIDRSVRIFDNVSINWTMIGFGFLILALAEIFEFGSSLQQDNESIV